MSVKHLISIHIPYCRMGTTIQHGSSSISIFIGKLRQREIVWERECLFTERFGPQRTYKRNFLCGVCAPNETIEGRTKLSISMSKHTNLKGIRAWYIANAIFSPIKILSPFVLFICRLQWCVLACNTMKLTDSYTIERPREQEKAQTTACQISSLLLELLILIYYDYMFILFISKDYQTCKYNKMKRLSNKKKLYRHRSPHTSNNRKNTSPTIIYSHIIIIIATWIHLKRSLRSDAMHPGNRLF